MSAARPALVAAMDAALVAWVAAPSRETRLAYDAAWLAHRLDHTPEEREAMDRRRPRRVCDGEKATTAFSGPVGRGHVPHPDGEPVFDDLRDPRFAEPATAEGEE